MNIIEAIKKAKDSGTAIYKAGCPNRLIVPTDTTACCIMFKANKNDAVQRWSPDLTDLLSEEWEVYGKAPGDRSLYV